MPVPIYSHEFAQLTPLERRPAAAFRQILVSEPPGYATDNRWLQVQKYDGPIYIAVKPVMGLWRGASYGLLKMPKPRRGRTTFGPRGTVAKSIATPHIQGQDDEYTPFTDLDFPPARILARPNPTETMGELAAKSCQQFKLTGVAPHWCVPNDKGRPVEMWSLKTPFLYPIYQRSQKYPRGAYRVTPYSPAGWSGGLPGGLGATGAVLPGEEVKRFMDPHPYLDWDGFSPLTAGGVQLDVLASIDRSRKSAMDRGVQLDVVMSIPGLSDGEAARIQKSLTEKHGGAENARSMLVFSPTPGLGEKATITPYGNTAREMDYVQSWEQMVKFALALFRVPASVAGLVQGGSYSENYAARQQFHDEQEDDLNAYGLFLTESLCWPWSGFQDEYVVRVSPRPIADKEMAEAQHERQCRQGTITLNESRAKDNLPPLPDGDLLLPVALAKQQQAVAPQPDPLSAGEEKPDAGEPGKPFPAKEAGKQDRGASAATKQGPTAGAAPKPANPAGKGSLPPRVGKAALGANTLEGSAGGFLVPDAGCGQRKRKRRGARRWVRKAIAALGTE